MRLVVLVVDGEDGKGLLAETCVVAAFCGLDCFACFCGWEGGGLVEWYEGVRKRRRTFAGWGGRVCSVRMGSCWVEGCCYAGCEGEEGEESWLEHGVDFRLVPFLFYCEILVVE